MIFGLVYKFIVGCVLGFFGSLSEAWFCAIPKNLAKNQRYASPSKTEKPKIIE
jgi:hypothetical protein